MRALGFILAPLLLLGAACSDREKEPDSGGWAPYPVDTTSVSTTTPRNILGAVQDAVDRKSSYRLAVQANNLVLPQWGGSDGGTVEVDLKANRARAVLSRTGEGGPYTIIWANGETVFQRATCKEWAKIAGQGANVLAPFIVAGNGAIRSAQLIAFDSTSAAPSVRARMQHLDEVIIFLDPATMLPKAIQRQPPAGGTGATLTFSDWDVSFDIPTPAAAYERGPGGNPC